MGYGLLGDDQVNNAFIMFRKVAAHTDVVSDKGIATLVDDLTQQLLLLARDLENPSPN